MNRIDRLFGILTLLQSRKFVPAEKIAGRFGISIRTVYRDVKALCEQGIPVSFEPSKGYFIVPGFFVPPVSFTNEEANALLLMESMVNGFADQSIGRHYSSALQKVRSVLKGHQKEGLERLDGHIRLQLPACYLNNFEYLSVLQTSISAKKIVELEYRSNAQEISKRKVEPIGLVFYAFSWHLIGWCHMRSGYRDFKVARILKATLREEGFSRSDHMALNDYMKQLPVSY
jgi:predicted DNA-binding transcriptional regulator YafY